MKKSKDLSKKNEGKEYKKKTIIKHHYYDEFGNPIAHKYHDHLFWKRAMTEYQRSKLEKRNDDGIKHYDIYNTCYTKEDLIKEYDFFKKKNTKKLQHGFLNK